MPDHREKVLKIVCALLGAVLAFQLTLFVVHGFPTRRLVIPALPSLPPVPEVPAGKGTNSLNAKASSKSGTNAPGTNAVAKGATNSVSTPTNSLATKQSPATKTNSLPETNSVAATEPAIISTNPATISGTNRPPLAASRTNSTNLVAQSKPSKDGTNSPSSKSSGRNGATSGGRPGAPVKLADLSPQVKERIDRISQGEILAPVMRPMPMALLGIGGDSAFLRSPDGQTGLVKAGDQLGTIKLLRIGTNRVLIEQDGEKKELMIFSGLGSETLLPKQDKTNNEPNRKIP